MKQRWGVIALVAVLSFVSGGWLLQGARATGGLPGPELLGNVLNLVSRYYVDSIPDDSLYHKAAIGFLDELHDPYSSLEEGADYRGLTEQITGNYGGLGIQIDVRDGWITVVAPLPQTPAERVGIESGDQIVEVDGKSTQGIKQDQAVNTLRGKPGTVVHFKVHRPGMSQLLSFAITRELIHFRSVQPGVLFDNGVGYVALMTVSDSSASELRQEVDSLLKRGMKGLILDLRSNPGGLLDQGAAVSNLFLNPGAKIVETRGRFAEMNKSFTAKAQQAWPTLPVVVLVNEYSASAAEIIAGALQDNDRAIVVGTPTFGKGLVQSMWQIAPGQLVKLTTGRWYTPSGRTIQRQASSQAEQVAQATAQALGTDTSSRPLPTFKTLGGRVVRGGGGIVPDRIVRGDTVLDSEKGFVRALGANVTAYRDALVTTALEIKEKKQVSDQHFAVSPAMRDEVVQRLKARGVTFTPQELAAGNTLLDEQLGYEVARYVFGREGELRRRTLDDPQVRAAIDLLVKAPTPAALMAEVGGSNSGQ